MVVLLRRINCRIRGLILSKSIQMAKANVGDNRLDTFRRVCDEIAAESGYKAKAELLGNFFKNGHDGKGFKGDLLLWVQMLIPQASQRVYNLQNKQMLKLFGRIFLVDAQTMQEELGQDGDVSVVLSKYFTESVKLKPRNESVLYLQDVEDFLKRLEQLTKEDEQTELLRELCKRTTSLDLRTIIRLIKQDLRINARARHILDAFGPGAYESYQASRDLKAVVEKFGKANVKGTKISTQLKLNPKTKGSDVKVMTPISPMLANACKSVEEAFKKSPTGLFSEIKYDGERVQIHKKGNEFRFFSRNLKPVMEHKIRRFKEMIPKAFPGGGDMILDSEIILVDTITGDLLQFGTLGAHKKKEHASAEVCLFVFDCILFDGENLTNVEFRKRRQILEDNINPIKSYVQLSESHFLKTKNELSLMTAKVLKANLEGVVLKNPNGTYQPGKRGWLKVKKDYLFGGKMADTADLVVLGGWFGSGKKGGILSIFLMGCFDPRDRLWKTVTKVHSGLDDAENDEVHNELMKLMQRSDANKTPNWLLCKKALVPDFLAIDPHKMPVWEITGAEFTKSEAHTAAGISIRFPRITKIRNDKSAEQANDLIYLQNLFDASKKDVNVDLLIANCDFDNEDDFKIDSKLNLSGTPTKNLKGLNSSLNSSNSSLCSSTSNKSSKRKMNESIDESADCGQLSKKPKTHKSPRDLPFLKKLFGTSKNDLNVNLLMANGDLDEDDIEIENELNRMSNENFEVLNMNDLNCSNNSSDSKKSIRKIRKCITEAEEESQSPIVDDIKKEKLKETKTKENPKTSQLKQKKLDFCSKAKPEDLLFKNVNVYFAGNIDDIGGESLKLFKESGGIISSNAMTCDIAIHLKPYEKLCLKDVRKQYNARCRHLSIKWLEESLKAKKFLPYDPYAMVAESDVQKG